MTLPHINHPAGGIPAQPPVGQDEVIALLKALLEAQQDANGIMRDVKSEIVTMRRVVDASTQGIIDQIAVSAPD